VAAEHEPAHRGADRNAFAQRFDGGLGRAKQRELNGVERRIVSRRVLRQADIAFGSWPIGTMPEYYSMESAGNSRTRSTIRTS
jgi:hypothetical protein